MKKIVLKSGVTFDISQELANEIKNSLINGSKLVKSISITDKENVEIFINLKSVSAIY